MHSDSEHNLIGFEEAERLAKEEAKKHVLLFPGIRERLIWQHTKAIDAWVFIVGLLPPNTQSFEEFLKKPCLEDGPEQRAKDWLSIRITFAGEMKLQINGNPNELWSI